MKPWLILFFSLLLTGCAILTTQGNKSEPVSYPDLGVAPELAGDVWINSDAPIHLADLRGKVVLLDMWTFD